MKKRFEKKDIFTIPNAMSIFRILLVPIIVHYYCVRNIILTTVLVSLSALTDIADGKIARKFNMVSDIGKMLDPVADKLTEFALLICLIENNKQMLILIDLMLVKEIVLITCGYLAMRKDSINSSKWYGKVCTVIVYFSCILMILIPDLSVNIANIIIYTCCFCVVASSVLYAVFYIKLLHSK